MRRCYTCVQVERGRPARTDLDQTPADFVASLEYGHHLDPTPETFLQRHNADWIMELHAALRDVLAKDRLTLGIGSGECEHEIRLFLEGYPVIGSDLVPEALAAARRLFPEFPARIFDIFSPQIAERFDDVLISGLDYALDEAQILVVMWNVRQLLKPHGRLVFVLRMHDNWATRLIDYVGMPLYCLAKNGVDRLRRAPYGHRLKFHAYRRTRRELVALARPAGFRLGAVRYGGFGVELTRVAFHRLLPPVYRLIRQLDRRVHWFNNVTVFEFLT